MVQVTIKTIANEAKVSISLVSQVLNNRDVRVSPETRERIIEVAEKYHYVPNKLASSLKSKQTNTIALLAPFTPNGFFSNLIYHVQKYADQAGYLTMVVNTFEDEERETQELELFQSGMFEGMIIAPLSHGKNLAVFQRMKYLEYPFVFVDRFNADMQIPLVSSDHSEVASQLTKQAIAEGKKDIVFLYRGNSNNSSGELRIAGYCQAMKDEGLTPQTLSFSYNHGPSDLEEIQEALSLLDHQPDAFFIHSGYYLPLLVHACRDRGFCLDSLYFLMVDGFNFTEECSDGPTLLSQITGRCTIALQDIDSIAKNAVELLLGLIGRKEIEETSKIVVSPNFLKL